MQRHKRNLVHLKDVLQRQNDTVIAASSGSLSTSKSQAPAGREFEGGVPLWRPAGWRSTASLRGAHAGHIRAVGLTLAATSLSSVTLSRTGRQFHARLCRSTTIALVRCEGIHDDPPALRIRRACRRIRPELEKTRSGRVCARARNGPLYFTRLGPRRLRAIDRALPLRFLPRARSRACGADELFSSSGEGGQGFARLKAGVKLTSNNNHPSGIK